MHNYIITCTVNGKVYTGCTGRKNLDRYFRQKMSAAICEKKPRGIPLHRAFRKYGVDSFVCVSVFQPKTKELMFALEKALIIILNSRDRNVGYNVTAGGEGALGVKRSAAFKRAVSERMKGKQYRLGSIDSAEVIEQKRKRAIGNKYGLGRKPSAIQQAALTANSFANKSPEEFRRIQEMAIVARKETAQPLTEEHKQKLSAATKGKPKSEETKQRMREAAARRTPEYKAALSALANQKRQEKLSPEQRSAIAKIASDAALAKKKSA